MNFIWELLPDFDLRHSGSVLAWIDFFSFFPGGLSQDLKAASSCFLMACEKPGKKSTEACHNVGLLAHDGQVNEDGQPNLERARDYYTRACDGNYAASCFNLSAMFL